MWIANPFEVNWAESFSLISTNMSWLHLTIDFSLSFSDTVSVSLSLSSGI